MKWLGLALLVCLLCNGAHTEREAGVPESCEGLDNIGNAEQLDCLRTVDCLSVTCNVTSLFEGYGAKMDLFPCHRPPGLEIFLISPNATTSVGEFDSSMPSRTTGVPLNNEEGEGGLTAEFQITVSWAIQQTATVKGEIVTSQGNFVLLDPTNVTLPACKPVPRPASTCLALQQIAATADEELQCTTNGVKNCDTIVCTAKLSEIVTISNQFEVLPCHNDTPAVHLVSKSGSTILLDHVLTESTQITVFGLTVDVTLNQLDGAIGLQVDLLQDEGNKKVLLPYSEIPIDKTKCNRDVKSTEKLDGDGPPEDNGADIILALSSWQLALFSALLLHLLLP